MSDSILNTTKKALGLDEGYTPFDPEIIMYINAVFADLNQLGLGPVDGFSIADDAAVWATYTNSDLLIGQLPTYMALRVRMMFDPPTTSFAINAMQEQIKQFEFRLLVNREHINWVDPSPDVESGMILDGGGAG